MTRALALVLLLAAPLCAQDFDVHALYEKWKAEECRTLEGWRVLDDDTLIERLGPLASRWRNGELVAATVSNPKADALLAVAYFHGVGGAPKDWLVARHLAASARKVKLPEAGYLCVRQLAVISTQDDALVVDVSGIDLSKTVRERLTLESFAAADYLLALLELKSEATTAAGRDRLLAVAKAGCLPAMVSEARRQQSELGATPDDSTWLETAAKAGYLPALVELGNWFHYHGGRSPDLERCRKAFQRAADLGSAYAMQQLGRLPLKTLEGMTIAWLYEAYLASWGDTVDVEVNVSGTLAKYCAGTPNPELARHPDLAYWLADRIDAEDDWKNPAIEEIRQARTMYAECFLRGTGGVGQDFDVAHRWLFRAMGDDSGVVDLLMHDYWLLSGGNRLRITECLTDAIDANFAPALRIQAAAALRVQAAAALGEERYGYAFTLYSDASRNFELTEPEALDQLRDLAKDGDVYAMRALYEHYSHSSDDGTKWLYWLNLAAKAGDPQAWLEMAAAYETGSGVEQDLAQAEDWYAKALGSLNGRAQAQAWFEHKRVKATVPQLEALLLKWEQTLNRHADIVPMLETPWHMAGYAQRAHALGIVEGTTVLGLCLLYGIDVAADQSEGRRLLLGVSGSACAAYEVARLSEARPGMSSAVRIYEALVMGDVTYAAYRLGVIHTEQADYLDHDKAFDYFKQAAEGGCLPAMVALAKAYKNGLGVEADATLARDWAQKAADEGDETAKTLLEEWK